MLVRVRPAPHGLPFSKVYLAYPKDQAEYNAVLELQGWTWHHGRESSSRCPAAIVGEKDVFWTTYADDAALIQGPGVWTSEQSKELAAELGRTAPRIQWEPRWRRFVVKRVSRLFRTQLHRVGGWKFHGGACDPSKCPAGCPFRGLYGYHTSFSMAVVPFADRLEEDALAELDRRRSLGAKSRDEDGEVSVPTRDGKTLRGYQRAGVRWALDTPRCLIGDEPGLGKTPQAIATVLALPIEEFPTVLVVCPAGVSSNWRREIESWSAEPCRVVVLCGSANLEKIEKERQLVPRDGERLWVISSYGSLRIGSSSADGEEKPDPVCDLAPPRWLLAEVCRTRLHGVIDGVRCESPESRPAKRKKGEPKPSKCAKKKVGACKGEGLGRKPSRGQRGDALASLPPFPMVIFDEAHKLSGAATQQTLAASFHAQRARRVIMLTGTPLPNDVLDMQPALAMLDPQTFERRGFSYRFCLWRDNGFGASPYGMNEARAAELQELLRSTVMIRRRKSDVLKEIPPKTYRTVLLEPTEHASKLLRQGPDIEELLKSKTILEARQARLDAEARNDSEGMLAAINAELDATGIVLERASTDRQRLGVEKVRESLRYIKERGEDGRKIIVFAQHLEVAHALHKGLGGDRRCVLLEGAVDPKKRGALVESFQTDPEIQYVVATISSSAEGITLTAAHTVVFVEFPWTSVAVTQCEDRAHRYTQKSTVEIDYLVIDKSMDATIAGLISTKARYARLALDASSEPEPVKIDPIESFQRTFQPHPITERRFVLGQDRRTLTKRPSEEEFARAKKAAENRRRRPSSMLEMLAADAAMSLPNALWTEEICRLFA